MQTTYEHLELFACVKTLIQVALPFEFTFATVTFVPVKLSSPEPTISKTNRGMNDGWKIA